MSLTVVMLTFNEEVHVARAIGSVSRIADRVLVVDSRSTDRTVEIAAGLGASVAHHDWVNYATQFNWALDQLPPDTDWVLRLDADEIVSEALADEIASRLPGLADDVAGVFVSRRMAFLRRPIRHGGVFPVRVLRLFRAGRGRCENRWMDEHILVTGGIQDFRGEILDDNLNTLTWWTAKHNSYASREAVDLLNLEHRFMPMDTISDLWSGRQAGTKRWIKERIYARLPIGLRAFAFFSYRYFIRLGFLDGTEGTAFHVLQCFWFRFLVDLKVAEVRRYMDRENADIETAIERVLGIRVRG